MEKNTCATSLRRAAGALYPALLFEPNVLGS